MNIFQFSKTNRKTVAISNDMINIWELKINYKLKPYFTVTTKSIGLKNIRK